MGKIVLRNGVKIIGTLPSGAGDVVLTRDGTTSEVGSVPAVDLSSYLSNSLTSAYIIVGAGSNIASKVPMTGQVLISNTGLTTITADTIVNSQINSAAGITYSKLNLTSSIVNNDISATANIARSKIGTGIANRLVVNDGTGIMIDAAAINPAFVLISDVDGIPTHSGITATVLSYLDATSSVQTQLNSKPTVNLTTPAVGDILYYDGSVYVNRPATSDGQVLTLSGGVPVWGAPTANGLPTGGTTDQYLRKTSGTDYATTWDTMTVSKLTDFFGNAADLNVLQGAAAAGIIPSEIAHLDGLSGNIQIQLDSKLSATLPLNNIFIGNSSNIAIPLGPGINGYVLTSVTGVPTWAAVSAGTPPGSDTQVIFNDGGSFGADAGMVYNKTNDALTIGTARLHSNGTTRNIFLGEGSGNFTNTGSSNIGIGYQTLISLTSGTSNVMFGVSAGDSITSGSDNIAIGANALAAATGAARNTCIGDGAGSLVTGNNNVLIGNSAGNNITSGGQNVVLGYDIDAPSATTSGQLNIVNSIFGIGHTATGTTISTGAIGIGTNNPDRRLHVEVDSAITNTVTNALRLTSTSTGTPATGIGVGIEFEVETAAGNNEIGGRIEAVATDVGAGTEDFDLRFYAMKNGVTPPGEFMRGSQDGVTVAATFGVSLPTTGSLTVSGTGGNVIMNAVPATAGTNTFSLTTDTQAGGGTNNSSSLIIKTGTSGGAGVSNSGHVFIDTGNSGPGGVAGSIGLFSTTGSFGSGARVVFISNATTAPTTNPTGGGILYVEAGALKFRGSSGTVTTIANA